jgi:hypothetical protein
VGAGDLTAAEVKAFYRCLVEWKKLGYRISNTFNSLRKTLDWPLAYSEIGYPHNLPRDSRVMECRHGKLVCWLDANRRLCPCPSTFLRPEFAVSIADGTVKEGWEVLGKKINCVACGGSDESTTFLALKMEDLVEVSFRVFRNMLR